MIVLARGVTYGSVKECSEALGVTVAAVHSALDRGSIDKLGLGRTRPKPVDVEGLKFRSMSAASLALGLPRCYVQEAFAIGSQKRLERVRFAAMRYKARLEMDAVRAASGKGDAHVA